jgi:cardiolipin synthase
VILVDDDLAAVGTANFDNRSVRLNFEIMLLFASHSFARDVSNMFDSDFTVCLQVRAADFAAKPFWFHFAVRVARLMAPVL